MLWFLKSVRFQIAGPAALVLGVVSASVAGGSIAIPIIDTGRAFGELPYTALLPLVFIIVIGAVMARAAPSTAAPSARAHPVLLTSVALIYAGLYGIASCAAIAGAGDANLAAARNVMGYVALLFIGQAALGLKRAPIVPAIYVIVATIFGRIQGVVQPWAWPAVPAAGPDVAVAAVVAAMAAAISCTSARHFTAQFYG